MKSINPHFNKDLVMIFRKKKWNKNCEHFKQKGGKGKGEVSFEYVETNMQMWSPPPPQESFNFRWASISQLSLPKNPSTGGREAKPGFPL